MVLGQVPHPPTGAGLSHGMLQHGPPRHESSRNTSEQRKNTLNGKAACKSIMNVESKKSFTY